MSLVKDLKIPSGCQNEKPEIKGWGFQGDGVLEVGRPWSRVGGQRS